MFHGKSKGFDIVFHFFLTPEKPFACWKIRKISIKMLILKLFFFYLFRLLKVQIQGTVA